MKLSRTAHQLLVKLSKLIISELTATKGDSSVQLLFKREKKTNFINDSCCEIVYCKGIQGSLCVRRKNIEKRKRTSIWRKLKKNLIQMHAINLIIIIILFGFSYELKYYIISLLWYPANSTTNDSNIPCILFVCIELNQDLKCKRGYGYDFKLLFRSCVNIAYFACHFCVTSGEKLANILVRR